MCRSVPIRELVGALTLKSFLSLHALQIWGELGRQYGMSVVNFYRICAENVRRASGFDVFFYSTKRSTNVANAPAIAAATITRHIGCARSVISPMAMAAKARTATPLPTSDQLRGNTGQSMFSAWSAPVMLCNRFHDAKPKKVLTEETMKRWCSLDQVHRYEKMRASKAETDA